MGYLSTDFDAIKKGQVDLLASDKEKKKSDVNSLYDSQETVLNDEYGRAVDDTKESYVDDYQKNAVQKLINERQVAENMANLGLTDSGLNRTQQTAVQLSYANQKGKLDLQKQKALDELSANLASGMATIKQNRLSDLSQVDTDFEQLATSRATDIYNANVEANTAMYKAEQDALAKIVEANAKAVKNQQEAEKEAAYIIKTSGGLLSRDYVGSLGDNGVNTIYDKSTNKVTYVDNNSGKKTTLPLGVNPYTGDDNLNDNTATAKAAKEYGTFSNGYQPKGIINHGELSAFDKTEVTGLTQTVWVTRGTNGRNTRYWVWDGAGNSYKEVHIKNGEWKVK